MATEERKRLTVIDLKSMANQGITELNEPTERIEYTGIIEPEDFETAIIHDKVRTSAICTLCKRKHGYGERYPKEAKIDPVSNMYDIAGALRQLFGTAFHTLPLFKRFGEEKEVFFDLDGVTGHVDIYLPEYRAIVDIKTTGWLKSTHDPGVNHVQQVATYYAAMNKIGKKVEQVFIWYIDRVLNKGSLVHDMFEVVFDHRDHESLEPFDMSKQTRFEVVVGWNIDYIWNEIVLPARQVYLDFRSKAILPSRMEDYDNFNHWLCKSDPFKSRCKLNAI